MIEIIAEPGCTAEGDKYVQHELIDRAAEAGATCFKSQWVSNPALLVARRNAEPIYETYYQWLNTPIEWHAEWAEHANRVGLSYACSVYLPGDVDRIAPYVKAIKIASFEAVDQAMIERADATGLPVWISTGMQSHSLARLTSPRYHNSKQQTIFHCVSAYPAPLVSLNMAVLGPIYGGFSDHSDARLTYTGSWAAILGATHIEAHLKLQSCPSTNPDGGLHAMNPVQFGQYVTAIRNAELARGDGVKRPHESERAMQRYRVVSA